MAKRRRVSVPITLTSVLVAITISLTVGWQILVLREFQALVEGFTLLHWGIAIVGMVFFVLIITATILQTVWLVREIRTNQRQQNFIDAVSHELHTPLASFRLYLETLRKPGIEEPQRSEFLDIMASDLDRLQGTIGRVLDAATSEERPGRREPVELRPLLDHCATEVCAAHRIDPSRVRNDVPEHAHVKGDAEQLRVALRNLLENAVRYSGPEPRVEIRARQVSGRKLAVAVEDRGPGIPASALRQIFQRFQRLPGDSERPTRGLGLGLYIVRNIARSHRGSVRAESDGPGHGSRFILTLPGQVDGDASPSR